MKGKLVLIGAVIVIVVALLFFYGFGESDDPVVGGDGDLEFDMNDYFYDELNRRGVEKVGQPIEGFTALGYMNAYPGLVVEDFESVRAEQGVYGVINGELDFGPLEGVPIHSAAETVSKEGTEMLLDNLSTRLGIALDDKGSVDSILELIAVE
jgi:hypothetical protein